MSKVFTIAEGLENMGAVRSGGQGSVYKGKRTGEIITAIKLLPTPILSESEEDKHYRDFTNEVKKLQRVNEEPNPNIVKILSYGVSETGCFPFIEMEFIDGPDLAELLKPPHPPIFTIKEIIKVAEQLSNALAHCHKLDVKHGDIKSNNVKFNKQTGNYILLDFGLAILSDEERRTSMRRAGAIEFMAPEQNEGRMLFETDVYSFGIILYELLAGQVPFLLDGNSETARNKVMIAHMETPPPDALSLRAAAMSASWAEEKKALEMQVPEWLTSLIYKCLQKNPQDRFRNGMELHDYISHHHIYTAEVAGLVKHEDKKWQAALTKKQTELEELKAVVVRQKTELESVQKNNTEAPGTYRRQGVSRAAFNALLVVLFLISAAAVYGLFFNKPVVGGVQAENTNQSTGPLQEKPEVLHAKISENTSLAKTATKVPEKRKRQIADSISKTNQTHETEPRLINAKQVSSKEEATTPSAKEASNDDNKANRNLGKDENGAHYKVRSVAYFHNAPDVNTRREAFINHWNNAVLKPLDEKNGFVYIVYTNDEGQTSKGWLAKSDLIKLK